MGSFCFATFGERYAILLFIFALVSLPTPSIAYTLSRGRSSASELDTTQPQISRFVRLPYLNKPSQVIEQMVNRMGRSIRNLPVFTAKMFGDKISTMARTGRRINNGIIKTGRSVTHILKELFN